MTRRKSRAVAGSRARRATARPLPTLAPELDALLGVESDREIAALAGCSPRVIRAIREAKGIAPTPAGRPAAAGVRRGVSRVVYLTPAEAAAHDAARGEQPYAEFARRAIEMRITPGSGDQWRLVADRLADALVGASDAPDMALAEYRALAATTT